MKSFEVFSLCIIIMTIQRINQCLFVFVITHPDDDIFSLPFCVYVALTILVLVMADSGVDAIQRCPVFDVPGDKGCICH